VTVSINGVSQASCAVGTACKYDIASFPVSVMLTGVAVSGTNFTGFQRPYCDVNSCVSDDPEFMPPTQNAWSPAVYTFTMNTSKLVYARFALPPVTKFPLTINVSGIGTAVPFATQDGAVLPLVLSTATSYSKTYTATIDKDATVLIRYQASPTAPDSLVFQKPYCEVNADYCAAALAADPDWYPPSGVSWGPAPYTFKVTGAKTVGAKYAPLSQLLIQGFGVQAVWNNQQGSFDAVVSFSTNVPTLSKVFWALTANGVYSQAAVDTTPTTPTTNFSIVVGGALPDWTYSFRVNSTAQDGRTAESNVITVTMPPRPSPSLPSVCKVVDGIVWCYDPNYNPGTSATNCTAFCSSLGRPFTIDNATWFNAQNTQEKCNALAGAFGYSSSIIQVTSFTYGCAEASTPYQDSLFGRHFICSTYQGCPEGHRSTSDPAMYWQPVCPCQ
jgi:hypothetical protein